MKKLSAMLLLAGVFLAGCGNASSTGNSSTNSKQVQIVAVGQDHQRRIGQRRVLDHPAGKEEHGQALAAALGMPHDAGPAVGFRVHGRTRGRGRFAGSVKLM